MLKSFYKLNLIKAIEWWKTTSRLQVASPLQNIFKFMQFQQILPCLTWSFCFVFSNFGDKRDFPQKTPSPKRPLPHLVIKAMP